MAKKTKHPKGTLDPRRRWADAVADQLVDSGVCERVSAAEEGLLRLRKSDRHIYLSIDFAGGRRVAARVDVTLPGYKTVASGQAPGQGESVGRTKQKEQRIVLEAVAGKPVRLKSDFRHSRLSTTVQIIRDLADLLEALDAALKNTLGDYRRLEKAKTR